MRKLMICGAAILSLGIAGNAVAADVVPEQYFTPSLDWTGAYAGIQAGGGWSEQQWTSTFPVTTGPFDGDGVVVGGTLGYNVQLDPVWVVGLEGDFSFSGIDANNSTTGGCGAAVPCSAEIDWLATVRGRAGVLVDPQWLVYATGGLAIAEIDNSQTALSPLATASTSEAGWTVGGGVEGMFGNWSAKAEYLYADFGQTPFCPAAGCGFVVVSDYTDLHIVRFGLNYHFGAGAN